jgi:hypothetical protein
MIKFFRKIRLEIRVWQIAENPIEFYNLFAGDKAKLETILDE